MLIKIHSALTGAGLERQPKATPTEVGEKTEHGRPQLSESKPDFSLTPAELQMLRHGVQAACRGTFLAAATHTLLLFAHLLFTTLPTHTQVQFGMLWSWSTLCGGGPILARNL